MHAPGAGGGGHCLPKDTWLLRYGLQKYGRNHQMDTEFIKLARKINDYMPRHMYRLIEGALEEKGIPIREAKVTILGVAYLENSDDTRNTPAYTLIQELEARGTEIVTHDPYVQDFPEAELFKDLGDTAKGSDCLAIVTKHHEYHSLDLKKIRSLMRTPITVDGRNVFKKEDAEKAGFLYQGIGKG
jgi:UDP-N-acetyl-D-mannosaminuronic acid dehydrogenase